MRRYSTDRRGLFTVMDLFVFLLVLGGAFAILHAGSGDQSIVDHREQMMLNRARITLDVLLDTPVDRTGYLTPSGDEVVLSGMPVGDLILLALQGMEGDVPMRLQNGVPEILADSLKEETSKAVGSDISWCMEIEGQAVSMVLGQDPPDRVSLHSGSAILDDGKVAVRMTLW